LPGRGAEPVRDGVGGRYQKRPSSPMSARGVVQVFWQNEANLRLLSIGAGYLTVRSRLEYFLSGDLPFASTHALANQARKLRQRATSSRGPDGASGGSAVPAFDARFHHDSGHRRLKWIVREALDRVNLAYLREFSTARGRPRRCSMSTAWSYMPPERNARRSWSPARQRTAPIQSCNCLAHFIADFVPGICRGLSSDDAKVRALF
jgi:hypothetical protein